MVELPSSDAMFRSTMGQAFDKVMKRVTARPNALGMYMMGLVD